MLKKVYSAPTTDVLEANFEGVICQSAERDGYGNAFEI